MRNSWAIACNHNDGCHAKEGMRSFPSNFHVYITNKLFSETSLQKILLLTCNFKRNHLYYHHLNYKQSLIKQLVLLLKMAWHFNRELWISLNNPVNSISYKIQIPTIIISNIH
eukprot:NODE_277_length_10928_cov_0.583987.p11 type:complete len:113 gc:universal NODE_277_length_10928_cov_0.583987:9288-8950(-)